MNAGLAAGGASTHDALRDLMGAAGRTTVSASQLSHLLPVLAGALHGVFACGLVIAALMIPVGLIVPRARPVPGQAAS